MSVKKNILITGRPRVGKSTIIKKVVERLRLLGYTKMGGFYTSEMAKDGRRTGFVINTLDGKSGRFAEIGLESRFTLGKYGIDMTAFETVALSALEDAMNLGNLVVIDEIGFMEMKSHRFRELVLKALTLPPPVIATIMRSSYDFPDTIKARDDVMLITVRVENRDRIVDEIIEMARELIGNNKS